MKLAFLSKKWQFDEDLMNLVSVVRTPHFNKFIPQKTVTNMPLFRCLHQPLQFLYFIQMP
jgi:hypothetical protein